MNKRIISILLAGNAASFSATLSLVELASETPDLTTPTGVINSSLVNGGPGGIDSTLDITLQFEAEFNSTNPAGEHPLFEFGGGAGTGFSMVLSTFSDSIRVQAEDGSNQLGTADIGLGSVPQGVPVTFTVSLDLSESTLNLFVDDELVSTVTGDTLGDWSGGNSGGFFALGGDRILKPNFGDGTSVEYTAPLETEAEALSNLRFYEGTFVDSVPEPSTSLLGALAGLGLLAKRRR